MDKTPISVLKDQIKFYQSFIVKLQTRDGIDENAAQQNLDCLIAECRKKVKEFKNAVKILKASKVK